MARTAVIGLGTTGSRVARSIAEGGHEGRGFDPFAGARESDSASGIAVFATAVEVFQEVEVVVLGDTFRNMSDI